MSADRGTPRKKNARPRASVIITTYNNPRYLEMVLGSYALQDRSDFEVVIADDGSGPETRALIARLQPVYPVPLIHAWQPDEGFRQSRAMNLAALRSQGAQLIFTDGDCVAPSHMVSEHLAAAQECTLVVGGHIRLDQTTSKKIDKTVVARGAHEKFVTRRHRLEMLWWHIKNCFYVATGARRRPKIYGLNFSIDRDTFFAVNGLDLQFENNARQDSDFRNRVRLYGARARCIWHRAIVVHLWHPTHTGRNGWSGADHYYKRRGLTPIAERGIRQMTQ